MNIRRRLPSFLLAVILVSLLVPAASRAQFWEAQVSMAYDGPETLSLFSLPNGAGKSFTQAFLPRGAGIADATITLVIYDGFGDPIVNFPAEDMWIGSLDGGMVTCGSVAFADQDTDAAGMTYWSVPLFAGGSSETSCMVWVNGSAVPSPGLPLHFNSADMDGSGVVNLTDAGIFAGHLRGPYAYAADFNYDEVINISDAGYMAQALGVACP